jgi:hypothetical protein
MEGMKITQAAAAIPVATLLAFDQFSGRSTFHIHDHDYSYSRELLRAGNNNNVMELVYSNRSAGNNF